MTPLSTLDTWSLSKTVVQADLAGYYSEKVTQAKSVYKKPNGRVDTTRATGKAKLLRDKVQETSNSRITFEFNKAKLNRAGAQMTFPPSAREFALYADNPQRACAFSQSANMIGTLADSSEETIIKVIHDLCVHGTNYEGVSYQALAKDKKVPVSTPDGQFTKQFFRFVCQIHTATLQSLTNTATQLLHASVENIACKQELKELSDDLIERAGLDRNRFMGEQDELIEKLTYEAVRRNALPGPVLPGVNAALPAPSTVDQVANTLSIMDLDDESGGDCASDDSTWSAGSTTEIPEI